MFLAKAMEQNKQIIVLYSDSSAFVNQYSSLSPQVKGCISVCAVLIFFNDSLGKVSVRLTSHTKLEYVYRI